MEDSGFRTYRLAFVYSANETAFVFSALLIVAFNVWDRYIDPAHAMQALWVRLGGAGIVIASGLFQRWTKRVEWAPWVAKFRMLATAGTIALALSLLDGGFLVGLSGLIIAMLGAAHSAIDRRDVLWLFLPPFVLVVAIMLFVGIERFVFVNSLFFLGLTLLVAWLLGGVLEVANLRAYRLERALLRESRVDALTGVENRRALGEHAHELLTLSRRAGKPCAVMLIDIDFFKAINDQYGHPVGDQVLRAVAGHCHRMMRESDRFGRWGGEEFLALLPDATTEQAAALAERMRASIAEAEWQFGDVTVRPTISIGVAGALPATAIDVDFVWEALVKAADQALYRAKSAGRNCVEWQV